MDIADASRAYLRGEASSLLSFAKAVARRLVESAKLELTPAAVRHFRSQIVGRTLDPDLVYTLALARTAAEAEQILDAGLKEFLTTGPIHVPDEEFDLIEYEGWSLMPRKLWEGWPGAREWPATLRGFSPTPFELQPDLVTKAIGLARTEGQPRPLSTGESLVRIDLIDVALYRALVNHPELLRTLNWRTFEKLLADLLERLGYEIELQRGTKDGGIDLFAIKRSDAMGPERYILQAKRWSHKVGVEPVRQLLFLQAHERATKACLATTARFTEGAWQLARQYPWQLELRDQDGLLDWIRRAHAGPK